MWAAVMDWIKLSSAILYVAKLQQSRQGSLYYKVETLQ